MRHRAVSLLRCFLLTGLTFCAACSDSGSNSGEGTRYWLTDLSPILGDSLQPAKMNAAGQFLAIKTVNYPAVRVYLWDSGKLLHLPCDGAYSFDLNDRGQVLCGTTVWDAGSLSQLTLPDTAARAFVLSDSGVVGGLLHVCAANSGGECVFSYSHGQMRIVPVIVCCGFPSSVLGIADASGSILYGYFDGIEPRAFLLQPSTGAVTPAPTSASNINASGQMAGTAYPSPGGGAPLPAFAWYFDGQSTTRLGQGIAYWINDRGDILANLDSEPVLLRGGARISLLHPVVDRKWTVTKPLMMDDAGHILAEATYGTGYHVVLLTPGAPNAPLIPFAP